MERTHVSSDIRSSTLQSEDNPPRYRQVSIGHPPIEVREEQGVLHMRALEPLARLPDRLLDRLVHWARLRPQQTFIAARQPGRLAQGQLCRDAD
ncbi:hypothetical protein ALQ60_102075 [Pseudomonas syringae pv. papulans]|nr:hypothetical protein ALO65_102202 [Pseudomonas syringae pv. papulans]RMN49038.1 hypothetical protein ALQ60_102075 [Pseudomonas syringae pv. papulans]